MNKSVWYSALVVEIEDDQTCVVLRLWLHRLLFVVEPSVLQDEQITILVLARVLPWQGLGCSEGLATFANTWKSHVNLYNGWSVHLGKDVW